MWYFQTLEYNPAHKKTRLECIFWGGGARDSSKMSIVDTFAKCEVSSNQTKVVSQS